MIKSKSFVASIIQSALNKPISFQGAFIFFGALSILHYSGKISGEVQFLLIATIAWMLLVYFYRSITTASLLTAIFLLPFDIGRGLSKIITNVTLPWGREDSFVIWFIISYADIIFFLLALAGIFIYIHRTKSWLTRTDYLVVALLGWAVITSFFAQDRSATIFGLLALLKGVVVYFVIRVYTIASHVKAKSIIVTLTWVVLFQGLWSLYQLQRGGPTGHFFDIASFKSTPTQSGLANTTVFRASGTFLDPNVFALYVTMLLPLTITMLLHAKTSVRRVFYGGASLMGVVAVMLSASRTGWIVLATILSLLVIKEAATIRRLIKRVVVHKVGMFGAVALLTIASFVIVPNLILPRWTNLYTLLQEGGVVKARLDLNKEAFAIIQNAPIFGVGLNNSVLHMVKNNITGISRGFLAEVHNLYLLIAAELGIPGLILTLLLFRETIKKDVRRMLPIENALRLGIVVYLLFGLSIPSFVRGAQFPTLMMLIALKTYWNNNQSSAVSRYS